MDGDGYGGEADEGWVARSELPEKSGEAAPPSPEHGAVNERADVGNRAAFTGRGERENGRDARDNDRSTEGKLRGAIRSFRGWGVVGDGVHRAHSVPPVSCLGRRWPGHRNTRKRFLILMVHGGGRRDHSCSISAAASRSHLFAGNEGIFAANASTMGMTERSRLAGRWSGCGDFGLEQE